MKEKLFITWIHINRVPEICFPSTFFFALIILASLRLPTLRHVYLTTQNNQEMVKKTAFVKSIINKKVFRSNFFSLAVKLKSHKAFQKKYSNNTILVTYTKGNKPSRRINICISIYRIESPLIKFNPMQGLNQRYEFKILNSENDANSGLKCKQKLPIPPSPPPLLLQLGLCKHKLFYDFSPSKHPYGLASVWDEPRS